MYAGPVTIAILRGWINHQRMEALSNDYHLEQGGLLRVLITSLVASTIALIVFILPAEFDSDPTGLGEMMGIKGMSGYSVGAFSEQDLPFHSDERVFELAPFESLEYKYRLEAGQSMSFSWTASTMTSESAEVLFDFHSEEDGTDPEDAVSFRVATSMGNHGNFVAPFSGIHGWFWENRGGEEVSVALKTSGFYSSSTVYGPSGTFDTQFSSKDP